MRYLIPFFAAAAAWAQIVSVGVRGGVPATPALQGFSSTGTGLLDTGRWTIGPTIEVRLPFGFSVEADALYRGNRTQSAFVTPQFTITPGSSEGTTYPPSFSSFHTNTKAWDFPLLLKYRIGTRFLRPFVGAGYTFSHDSSDVTTSSVCLGTPDQCANSNANPFFLHSGGGKFSSNPSGPTAALGVEFTFRRMKISPEIRYTRFSNPTMNQGSVLVGFTF